MTDKTMTFKIGNENDDIMKETLTQVFDALQEKGYNPINQIVGYLMSGDPGYISSHKEARNKITKIDRAKLIEVILKNFIK